MGMTKTALPAFLALPVQAVDGETKHRIGRSDDFTRALASEAIPPDSD